jgi:hypothetical protein
MIGTLRSFVLGMVIGWPSRALWLLRTKRDPLEILQDAAERRHLVQKNYQVLGRRPDTASDRPNKPRIIACGASGIAYRF